MGEMTVAKSAESGADATNPFLQAANARDQKALDEFWLQVTNFALYSDEALKKAVADPKHPDQVTLKLPLPSNGDTVVDMNFKPELDPRWMELCRVVHDRRLGLILAMSDSRDNWRERTLCLRWSTFILAMQNERKS